MNYYIDGFRIDWQNVPKQSYARSIKALCSIQEFRFNAPITFFVGENGSGKSTLLEAIAQEYGFNKEGGSKNYNFSTFDESTPLKDALTLYKGFKKEKYSYFFRAETFFNIATKEEEYSKGPSGQPQHFHEKSHGEGFFQLFNKLADSNGLFMMDEPEAALSASKQLQLFSLIYSAAKKGCQFIIATHSPILLAIPDAEIYNLSQDGMNKCTYEQTDSYKVTSSFINHKDIMVKELINNE